MIEHDKINPSHYKQHPSGVECIDVVQHMSFNIGNAVKYLWRHGLKPGEGASDDLSKAIWYIEQERKRLSPPTCPSPIQPSALPEA